ncbi:chaperonin 10-like protein [Pilaira anomala]|nr:chaperonin 10-like protein [Pilaira anomala]
MPYTTIPETMHGVQVIKYGISEDSLIYSKEVPVPKLKTKTQVLIRVKAAGVNPVDAKAASGNMKLATITARFPFVPGADYAGVIVAMGEKVTDFELGDEVFGSQEYPFGMDGSYAQYILIDTAKAAIAKKPQELSFEQAASAGIAVMTAYQGIITNGGIDESNKHQRRNILIIGASGGVGSYGVQIAKILNHQNNVIGICSEKNVEYVKSLGADRVINYRDQENYEMFINENIPFDVILDCVGGDDYYKRLGPLLTKDGIFSSAVGPVAHAGSTNLGLMDFGSIAGNIFCKKLFGTHRYDMITSLPYKDFKDKIAPFFKNLEVRGTVQDDENIIPLKDVHKAFEKIKSHRTVGKIVLSVD